MRRRLDAELVRRRLVGSGPGARAASDAGLVLIGLVAGAQELGLSLRGATVSPITGAAGNIEFFVLSGAGRAAAGVGTADGLLDDVVARAEAKDL